MNNHFQRLMRDATLLTRSGDLAAASAAIRAALAQPDPDRSDFIDVEARFVPDPDLEPLPAAPHEPIAEPPHTGEGAFVAGRFGTGPASRDYKLYVPPAAGARPLPLVVMLHGCTQDPDDFAAGTAMNEAARADGFFVLYPAQSAKANPRRCWNWFKHTHQERGRGEAAILAGMTQDIIARHAIDASRVYVAGLSAGGAMAAILGQAYPDVFAAVGVHSGLPHDAARDLPSALKAMQQGSPRRRAARQPYPTPVIVFHGDADPTVHPRNGEALFDSAHSHGDVRTQSGRVAGGHAWTHRVKPGLDGAPHAEHWEVHGAAHAWSGGQPHGSYTDLKGPDATREMLRFFAHHSQRKC